MGLVLLILGLLVVVALFVAVPVVFLVRKNRRMKAALDAELAADPPVRGPESALYHGSTGGYSNVSGNGQLVLTAHRLMFRKITGGHVDIPVSEITSVTQEKSFNHSVRAGHVHLVVHTHRGAVGFYVDDLDAWTAALAAAGRA